MRLKLTFKLIFPALLVATVLPIHSQVSPAANQGGVPIVVGAGFSDFSIDWGPGKRMEGISAWADWYPNRLPAVLNGLGIEAEGRDIDFGRPAGISRMRQDTGLGGLIYTWNHYRNFRPYVKYLAGVGSIDFPPGGHTRMTRFRSIHPAGVWSIALGNTSGSAEITCTSSGTTPSGILTSHLPALRSALLTTSDLGCLSKDRPCHQSVSGPVRLRIHNVQGVSRN